MGRLFHYLRIGFAGLKRSRKTGRGDFANFFVSEVRDCGGQISQVGQLPIIEGHWKIERDRFGFQIHLFDVEFERVDALMTLLLGEPEISAEVNREGNPQRMYDRNTSGMHVQLIGEESEIYIVAVGRKKK